MNNEMQYRIRFCKETGKFYADILCETFLSSKLRLVFPKRRKSFVWKGITTDFWDGLQFVTLTNLNDDLMSFDTEEKATVFALKYLKEFENTKKTSVNETSVIKTGDVNG